MFYGWKLCYIIFLGNFFLQGSLVYMMNAFIDPLTVAHGWTRAQVSLGMSFGALFSALSVPVWTSLALKFSIRNLMTMGAFLGGTSLIILGSTGNLMLFYIFYTLAWVSGQAFGGALGTVLMNQWFSKDKGKAFGLCTVGTSLSGAIIPFILLIVITNFDVQVAWTTYGFIILAFAPICWFFVRDKPEDMGLRINNLSEAEDIPPKAISPVSFKEILKNKDVYIFALSFSFTLMVISAVISQLKPRMVDVGLESYTAMAFSCLTALFLAIAKYIWGKACDVYNPIKVTRVLFASIFCSLVLIFIPPSLPILFLFSFCFGITVGGGMSVFPAAIAFYFGKDSFIFYYRVISTFVLIKALGYGIIALSLQLTGSYDFAYICFCGILIICLIATFFLKTTPPYLSTKS